MFSFLKREGRKEESKVDSPGTPSAFILQRQLLTKLLSVKDNPVALSKEAKIAADWLKEWEVHELLSFLHVYFIYHNFNKAESFYFVREDKQ